MFIIIRFKTNRKLECFQWKFNYDEITTKNVIASLLGAILDDYWIYCSYNEEYWA